MTFIIDTGASEMPLRGSRQPWPESVVASKERSFQPANRTGNFKPAGERYWALSHVERDALIAELALALSTCDAETQSRMVHNFRAIDPDYGRRVSEALAADR